MNTFQRQRVTSHLQSISFHLTSSIAQLELAVDPDDWGMESDLRFLRQEIHYLLEGMDSGDERRMRVTWLPIPDHRPDAS